MRIRKLRIERLNLSKGPLEAAVHFFFNQTYASHQPVRFHIPADAVVCSFLQEQLPLAGRLQYLLVE